MIGKSEQAALMEVILGLGEHREGLLVIWNSHNNHPCFNADFLYKLSLILVLDTVPLSSDMAFKTKQ